MHAVRVADNLWITGCSTGMKERCGIIPRFLQGDCSCCAVQRSHVGYMMDVILQ